MIGNEIISGEAIIDASQVGALRKVACESSMAVSHEVKKREIGVIVGEVACRVTCDHCGIDRKIGPLEVKHFLAHTGNSFADVGNGIEYIVLSECQKAQAN